METPALTPLAPEDPPRLGDFWLEGRLSTTDAGAFYLGHDDKGRTVTATLLSEGAAQDPAARERFEVALERLRSDGSDDAAAVLDVDLDPEVAPWVVTEGNGSSSGAGLDGLLSAVMLGQTAQARPRRGPDFVHHWADRRAAGFWRLWPLPWPRHLTSAAWWAFLVAAALILLITVLALLLVIWLFPRTDTPPPPFAPYPVPTPSDQSPSDGGTDPTTPPTDPSQSPSPGESPSESPSDESPSVGPSGPTEPGTPGSPPVPTFL